MLTANRLEKIMELEAELRAEYQEQLDAKTAEIEAKTAEIAGLNAKHEEFQGTINKQLVTITDLSQKAGANQKVEQRNRELHNRAENLQTEIAELKQRLKTLQKDLSAVREENKELTRLDPQRMKKNLDANKKKLAEKTKAADTLQKSLNESKRENSELERKVAELEAKLETPEVVEEPEQEASAA